MTLAMLTPTDLLDDRFFSRLKAHIIEVTGLAYYASQDLELARLILQRMVELDLADCSVYWNRLSDGGRGATELDQLIAALTIGETFFFRHEEQFHSLRDQVLPEVLERNRTQRRLRIWSAGCATGAEVYSLAILLKQTWGDLLADWDVSIVGTDINRSFLTQARQGRFGDWALRGTSKLVQSSCFLRSGNEWRIRPEYRQWTAFRYHNLVQDPFPSASVDLTAFDVILCRNVMIYFDEPTIRRIIPQFYESVTEDGWLLVGHAECKNELFSRFRTINSNETVLYQRTSHESCSARCSATATQRFDASATWPTSPQVEYPPERVAPRSEPGLPSKPIARKPIAARPNRRDEWEEACRLCRKQLSEEPLDAEVQFRYASLLQERGSYAAAEQALRRTLYLDRDFVLAHFNLGQLFERRGELSGAKRSFRNALRLLEPLDPFATFSDASRLNAGELTETILRHLALLKHV